MLNEFDYNPLCVRGISNFKGLEIETMENYRTSEDTQSTRVVLMSYPGSKELPEPGTWYSSTI
jgi:hypothetical protein